MKKNLFLFFCFSQIAFAQDLIPYKQGDLYGYRLEKSIQINPKFEYALDFSENLALVKFNGKWGYIDSKGMWIIEPIFQKASPFMGGQAFVNLNGKIGLIRKDGTYLLEAKYDEIARNEHGYELKLGKMVGLYAPQYDELIEPQYTSISKRGVFTSCQRTDYSWDIYKNGILFIEKADQPFKANDLDDNYITFYVNKKKGLYLYDQGWLFEPVYEEIEKFETYDYNTATNSYNYGFWLTLKREWSEDPDLGEIISVQLATGDGKIISPEVFDFVKSNFNFYDSENTCIACIELISKEKKHILTTDMKIVPFEYDYLRHQANRLFGTQGDKTYIFDKNLTPIDSFLSVEPFSSIEMIENEFGEIEMLPVIHSNHEIVWVSKQENNQVLNALYDLNKARVISDWFATTTDLNIETIEIANQTIHLIKNSESLYAFYNQLMDKMTDFSYLLLNNPLANFLVGVKKSTHQTLTFAVNNRSITPIAITAKASNSESLRKYVYQENNDVIIENYYNTNFLVLENTDGKIGLITETQHVFLPQFDSIQPSSSIDFVTTRLNGKFGLIHLNSGSQIPPNSDQVYEPQLMESNLTYYVQVGEGESAYFLNMKGQKMKTLNPILEILRVKNRFGIQTNNDFNSSDKFITIQPIFKSLTPADGKNFIAQNTAKKFGVINYLGDTLVPFQYSKIEFYSSDNSNPDWMYYRIYEGKKMGIASNFSGVIFEPAYNSITQMEGVGWLSTSFLLEKKGRVGMGDFSGQVVMDCIYDKIQQINAGRSTEYGMYEGKIGLKSYVQTISYNEDGFSKVNSALRPLDLIVGENGFVKNGEFYEKYNLTTNTFIGKTTNLDETYSNGEYILSFKNGKWGALDLEGNQLIDFIYDEASFMQDRSEIMIGYENGVKYYIYVFTKERYTENEW